MKTRQLTIPMFPLNTVLLPGETTKLFIFENRYRQMISECLENEASFGIPYTEKGHVKSYGSEVKIRKVLKTYQNGSMDIVVECTGLFKLLEYSEVLRPKLYGAGLIEYLGEGQKLLLNNLQDATVNYFNTIQGKLIDYDKVSQLTVYSVASALQLTSSEKYRLVSSSNQQMYLWNLLNFITHVVNMEQQIKERFTEN